MINETFMINENEFKIKDSQLVYALLGHEKKPSDAELQKVGKSELCKEATEYVTEFEKGKEVISLNDMLVIFNSIGISIDSSLFSPFDFILKNTYINKRFVMKVAQAIIYNSISVFEIADMIKKVLVKSNSIFKDMGVTKLQIDLDKDGIGNFFKIVNDKKKELLQIKMKLGEYLSFGDDELSPEELESEDVKSHMKAISDEKLELTKDQMVEPEVEVITPDIVKHAMDAGEAMNFNVKVADREFDVKKLQLNFDLNSIVDKVKDCDRKKGMVMRLNEFIDKAKKVKSPLLNDRYSLLTVDEKGFIMKGKSLKKYLRFFSEVNCMKAFDTYEDLRNNEDSYLKVQKQMINGKA